MAMKISQNLLKSIFSAAGSSLARPPSAASTLFTTDVASVARFLSGASAHAFLASTRMHCSSADSENFQHSKKTLKDVDAEENETKSSEALAGCENAISVQKTIHGQFIEALKRVHLMCEVVACDRDKRGICPVFLMGVRHGNKYTRSLAEQMVEQLKPAQLFLELDQLRYKFLDKESENCEFAATIKAAEKVGEKVNILPGDITGREMFYIQRKIYAELIAKFSSSNDSVEDRSEQYTYLFSRAWEMTLCNVRDIFLFNKLWESTEKYDSIVAIVGLYHIPGIVHFWKLKNYGSMEATMKYRQLKEFCEVAATNGEMCYSGPDISKNLYPFPKHYANRFFQENDPPIW